MDSREAMKAFACDFFYWWYNQPGSNTRAGFDEFAETDAGKLRIIGLEAALSHQAESAEPVGDLLREDPVSVLEVFCAYARDPLESIGVPADQITHWFHGLKKMLTDPQPAVPEPANAIDIVQRWPKFMQEYRITKHSPEHRPAAPAEQWISCKDQMPKLGQRVILKIGDTVQWYMPLLDSSDNEDFWDFDDFADEDLLVDIEKHKWMTQPP